MSTFHEDIFVEERDLPTLLELVENDYSVPEEIWVKCYCRSVDISWFEPNCGSTKCLRRSYDFVLNSLTVYSSEHAGISAIINDIPIVVLRLLTNEKLIFKSKLMLSKELIQKILSFNIVPLELLLYIYYHQPISSLAKIKNHNQFLKEFLDHILRKKVDSREIEFLKSYPKLISDLFWKNKEEKKWKQTFSRFLSLPYVSEESLAYVLRCTLDKPDELKIRSKIFANPKMQRIVNESKLVKNYNKIREYSTHWFWEVRNVIAQNEITQKRVLESLSCSSGYYSKEIKISLIENPSTLPKIIQNILLEQNDEEVIIAALKRPDLSIKSYESFVNFNNDKIRNLAILSVAALSQQPKNLFQD